MQNCTNKPKILIGVPVQMDRKADLATGIFCGRMSAHTNVDFLSKIAHKTEDARNLIIKDFLAMPDYTHLFFLDADTVPPDDAIARLLTHDKDIVAGVTPMFFGGMKLWNAAMSIDFDIRRNRWIPRHCLPTKLFSPYAIGGTTILIKRHVLEALEWPYFLSSMDETGFRIGEDVYFADKARCAGFQLWCDPNVRCHHFQTRDLEELL